MLGWRDRKTQIIGSEGRSMAKAADPCWPDKSDIPWVWFDSHYDSPPPEPFMSRPNFIELPTYDLAASQVFFETVFGMKMTSFGPTYACTLTGDVDIGLQADQAEATKAPLPVVAVEDLDATLSAVIAASAAVTKPIFSFPGGRRFHFLDPSGNELAAMQADST
jgi:uncharacterized protein